MARVHKNIRIAASVEKVYQFVTDTLKMAEVWPSLLGVKNGKDLPNGGTSYEFTYMMAGMRLSGVSEDIELVPNEKYVSRQKAGISSVITWTFEHVDGFTNITFGVDYQVPIPLVGRVAESVVASFNDLDIEAMLNNLKHRLETFPLELKTE